MSKIGNLVNAIGKAFTKSGKTVQMFTSKHLPEILIGGGLALTTASTVLAVKATPKALVDIEKKKRDEGLGKSDKLPLKDTVQVTWRTYLPATLTHIAGAAMIIGSDRVHAKRNAAIYTAYKLSETAFKEYKDSVVEVVGEKKEKAIRDTFAKKQVDKNPVDETKIITTGKGSTLFLETLTGRYFYSDRPTIEHQFNKMYKEAMDFDGYIKVNDVFDAFGLIEAQLGKSFGRDYGWNLSEGPLDLYFSATVSQDGLTPVMTIEYSRMPGELRDF